jgi:hypothetical protein
MFEAVRSEQGAVSPQVKPRKLVEERRRGSGYAVAPRDTLRPLARHISLTSVAADTADAPFVRALAAAVQRRAACSPAPAVPAQIEPPSAAERTGLPPSARERARVVHPVAGQRSRLQRKLRVNAGLSLDTRGFSVTKTGDTYTAARITQSSLHNELFSALLASPREFHLDGNTDSEVETNLLKHMAARRGIVEFAAKKKYTFAAGAGFRMNPAYWVVTATGAAVKAGVNQQEAFDDLNVHPEKYAIACQAATRITMMGGSKSPLTDDLGVDETDWIPGDWGYILNTKFPPDGQAGLEGENLIYSQKGQLWGHFGPGIEYKTLQQWFDQVKGWHGGAETQTLRTRPTAGLT